MTKIVTDPKEEDIKAAVKYAAKAVSNPKPSAIHYLHVYLPTRSVGR